MIAWRSLVADAEIVEQFVLASVSERKKHVKSVEHIATTSANHKGMRHLKPRSYHRSAPWLTSALFMAVVIFLSACALVPKTTQQQIEAVMAGYPSAIGLQRTMRAVDFDTGIWFTFTTNDPKEQILTYYDRQLHNLGFRVSRPPYSLENYHFEASYEISDCPLYGAEVKVDETTKQVTVLLTISVCR